MMVLTIMVGWPSAQNCTRHSTELPLPFAVVRGEVATSGPVRKYLEVEGHRQWVPGRDGGYAHLVAALDDQRGW